MRSPASEGSDGEVSPFTKKSNRKGKRVKRFSKALTAAAAAVGLCAIAGVASADAPMVTKPDGAKSQQGSEFKDGKWQLPDGSPTYNIQKDGKYDWYAYNGFRRYHAECHVCHGPEGEGSTYAPSLVKSLQTMDWPSFMQVVASGRERTLPDGSKSVMPAFGDNKNVFCYVEDLYVYLKGRADGAIPRGRPPGREDKPQQAIDYDKQCFSN
jgi:methanol metabolism-related c-type cytochrome